MITITKALAGYTRISWKGEEIAKHNLSATHSGTREAFNIPEDISVQSWLEDNFLEEIKQIESNQSHFYIEYLNKSDNFKRTKKEFKTFEDAENWGRENLENFNLDLINLI